MEFVHFSSTHAEFGTWKSPISSEMIASHAVGFQEISSYEDHLYWLETRPIEEGRTALVLKKSGQPPVDLIPDISVSSRVHEYGGGAMLISKNHVYFINAKDQGIYHFAIGESPTRLFGAVNLRFADMTVDPHANFLICVCEEHLENKEVINSLVQISLKDGSLKTIAKGHDFYSSPRISPDGKRLAWIAWDHPNMPWDDSQLWMGFIENAEIKNPVLLSGGVDESVCQPQWAKDGYLYFISDKSGWWNLYRWKEDLFETLYPAQAEFSLPPWLFGRNSYLLLPGEQKILCIFGTRGIDHLGLLSIKDKKIEIIDVPFTVLRNLTMNNNGVYFFGASPQVPLSLIHLDLSSKKTSIIKRSVDFTLDESMISVPEEITFPTSNHKLCHAFYYPPKNKHFTPFPNKKPPLIVKCHGGPTAHVQTGFQLETQYWTTRGFGIVDVNYGGSSGFGRDYRKRLEGKWGIVDVEDCVNAALYLANQNRADKKSLLIKGGSAGGFTVLCALTFYDVFAGGTCLYGVSDLKQLLDETHKFESHYLDKLIGPFPQQKKLYAERSPILHLENLVKPVLFFQGRDDPVVPLNQTLNIFESLKQKGTPVSLIVFDQEKHGFKKAENIKKLMDSELYFYSKILKFNLNEFVLPITIENMDNQTK